MEIISANLLNENLLRDSILKCNTEEYKLMELNKMSQWGPICIYVRHTGDHYYSQYYSRKWRKTKILSCDIYSKLIYDKCQNKWKFHMLPSRSYICVKIDIDEIKTPLNFDLYTIELRYVPEKLILSRFTIINSKRNWKQYCEELKLTQELNHSSIMKISYIQGIIDLIESFL